MRRLFTDGISGVLVNTFIGSLSSHVFEWRTSTGSGLSALPSRFEQLLPGQLVSII